MPRRREGVTELYAARFRLWRELVNLGDFVRGTVVVLHRPCTRSRCQRCESGEKHPATYLSVSQKGRTRLLYLPEKAQPRAREWVENYRHLVEVIERVSEINREILRRIAQDRGQGTEGKTR